MAQGSEHPAVRVIKGHGTDSGHGIPQPDAQLIAALGILNGLDRELDRLSVPGGPQGHGIPLFITQDVLDLLDGVDLLTIDVGDDITRLQAAGPARAGRTAVRLHRRQAHHQHAVGKQLDAHRPAQGDHLVPHLGA